MNNLAESTSNSTSNILFYIPQFYTDTKSDSRFDGIIHHLQNCPNLLSNAFNLIGRLPYRKWNDTLHHGLAHLLLEAMHNYTYRTFHGHSCSNGKFTISPNYNLDFSLTNFSNARDTVAPNTSGNILLIFLLLGYGLVSSIVVFLFEAYRLRTNLI